jgi:superfamily II DNA helicase RecQ
MSRKVRRVPVSLDSKGIRHLADSEIALILRGADDLIGTGGRTLLTRILKGSRIKKLLELGLDQSPVFGALGDLSPEHITARIDWLIINGYLAIEYDYRLPVLIYTRKGWEIERKTYTAEMLMKLDQQISRSDSLESFEWLNEINRQVIMGLLDVIEASANSKYLPALRSWSSIAVRKVRQKIEMVVSFISDNDGGS